MQGGDWRGHDLWAQDGKEQPGNGPQDKTARPAGGNRRPAQAGAAADQSGTVSAGLHWTGGISRPVRGVARRHGRNRRFHRGLSGFRPVRLRRKTAGGVSGGAVGADFRRRAGAGCPRAGAERAPGRGAAEPDPWSGTGLPEHSWGDGGAERWDAAGRARPACLPAS